MAKSLAFFLLGIANLRACAGASAGATLKDLQRARTRTPRTAYRGDGHAHLQVTLNSHLVRSEEGRTRPCDGWALEGLHDLVTLLNWHRSPELQELYAPRNDTRSLWMSSDDWKKLEQLTAGLEHRVRHFRHAICREAVMLWTHHLTDGTRKRLRAASVTVPLLAGDEGPGALCDGKQDHFCKTLQTKAQEINCHANLPCPKPPCGAGPFPVGWRPEFRSEYYSPSKRTQGVFAIGKDSSGQTAGLISMGDGTGDHLCSAYHNNTPCTELETAGWRWLVWPELTECCKCCTIAEGCGPLNPTWLENATGRMTYKGTVPVDFGTSEQDCMSWNVQGFGGYNYYYEQIPKDGKPGLPCGIRGINYLRTPDESSDDYYVFNQSTFSTDVPASLFDLPSYCKQSSWCSAPVCNRPTTSLLI